MPKSLMSIGGLHPSEKMRGSASGLEKTTRRTLLSADGCAAATLVIAGLGLGRSYIRSQPVLATACAILAAISFIVLVRRLWVRLLGPVLFYELVRLARRNRYFLIRALYLGIIGALLYWQYRDTVLYTRIYTVFPKASVSINQAAVFSEQFFNKFMVFEFALILLLTPAYTAGAIAEEKDRKTLEFILATDLSSREIVLSKFLSRIANLSLIVMTGLPVLSATQFLGGVDPGLLLASFAAIGLTIMSVAGVSIACSVYSRKPRDAILLTYFVVTAYVSFGILGEFLLSSPGVAAYTPIHGIPLTVSDLVGGYNAGNLPVVLYRLREAVMASATAVFARGTAFRVAVVPPPTGSLASVVPPFLRNYAIFHGLIIVLTTAWAASRLRVVALGQRAVLSMPAKPGRIRWLRPAVGRLPMLWKEIFVEPGFRLTRTGRVVIWLLIILSFTPALWIAWQSVNWVGPIGITRGSLGTQLNGWVRIAGTGVASLLLVGVAVRAATSIGGERDRDTLDGLLMSPLESNDLLFAKWLGSLLSVRWGWLWLFSICGIGVVTGAIHPAAVLLSMAAWTIYASCLAGIGIWYSTACRTTIRAMICTVLITAFLGAGQWVLWICCLPFGPVGPRSWYRWTSDWNWFYGLSEILGTGLSMLSPPEVLYHLSATASDVASNRFEWDMHTLMSGFGMFLWTIGAVCIWSITRRRFRKMTARMPYRRAEHEAIRLDWNDPWE